MVSYALTNLGLKYTLTLTWKLWMKIGLGFWKIPWTKSKVGLGWFWAPKCSPFHTNTPTGFCTNQGTKIFVWLLIGPSTYGSATQPLGTKNCNFDSPYSCSNPWLPLGHKWSQKLVSSLVSVDWITPEFFPKFFPKTLWFFLLFPCTHHTWQQPRKGLEIFFSNSPLGFLMRLKANLGLA